MLKIRSVHFTDIKFHLRAKFSVRLIQVSTLECPLCRANFMRIRPENGWGQNFCLLYWGSALEHIRLRQVLVYNQYFYLISFCVTISANICHRFLSSKTQFRLVRPYEILGLKKEHKELFKVHQKENWENRTNHALPYILFCFSDLFCLMWLFLMNHQTLSLEFAGL